MLGWLLKLDPDTVIGVLTFLGTVGGWAWRRARGESHASFRDTINLAIDNLVLELLGELDDEQAARVNVAGYLNAARDRLEPLAWKVLIKRGVPRTKLTARYVNQAIEAATARLGRELLGRQARARKATP